MKIGKKSGKIKRGTLVAVSWLDANSPRENGWVSEGEFRADSPKMKVVSVGFFSEFRKGYIRLAGDWSESKFYTDNVNRVFNIPLGCVLTVRKFT